MKCVFLCLAFANIENKHTKRTKKGSHVLYIKCFPQTPPIGSSPIFLFQVPMETNTMAFKSVS